MVSHKKIVANGKVQMFERLNFSKRFVKKFDGRVCQTVLTESHGESVKFVNVEIHIPGVGPAPDFIKVCSEGIDGCLPI